MPRWPLPGKLLQKRMSAMLKITTITTEHQCWMQNDAPLARFVPMQATKVARAPASKIVKIRNRASDLSSLVFDVDLQILSIWTLNTLFRIHFETWLKMYVSLGGGVGFGEVVAPLLPHLPSDSMVSCSRMRWVGLN